jgi:predicted nucleic acid-binding protein
MIFLDTNIFLRYLTKDDLEKSQACLAMLQRIQGGEEATTSEVVLAEVAFVLSSPRQYGLSHADVSGRLRPVLLLHGLKVPNKRRILRALDLYATHPQLDFEDCLTVAQIEQQNIATLMSYDRGFDRVVGITRDEPPMPQVPQPLS